MEPGRQRQLVTAAVLAGLWLAALESSAVSAAMPTVVGDLGGVARYSWVFSAYLLTSTATVPLFGKLADLLGRGRVYHVSAVVFLLGSALCGVAQSLEQLIFFRALQGLGAGGLFPSSITLIGDIYSLEERGKVQGLFAANWAVASLLGPAVGGLVTDLLSWRWVFYLNLPMGILSIALLAANLREPKREVGRKDLDLAGSLLLLVGSGLLLTALLEGGTWGWGSVQTVGFFTSAAALLALFLWQERRAADPVLPLELFRQPLISIAYLQSALLGGMIFAVTVFVPILGQGVLGGSALDAGILLAPISIGWPIASTLAGRSLMRAGYRRLMLLGSAIGLVGMVVLAAGVGWLEAGRGGVMISMFVLGFGLGLISTPQLVAVQNAVPWARRGVATSSLQFFRSIGGAVAVAAFGALLAARLRGELAAHADALLDPLQRQELAPDLVTRLAGELRQGLTPVFVVAAGMALCLVVAAVAFPAGSARQHAHAEPAEEP